LNYIKNYNQFYSQTISKLNDYKNVLAIKYTHRFILRLPHAKNIIKVVQLLNTNQYK